MEWNEYVCCSLWNYICSVLCSDQPKTENLIFRIKPVSFPLLLILLGMQRSIQYWPIIGESLSRLFFTNPLPPFSPRARYAVTELGVRAQFVKPQYTIVTLQASGESQV